MAESWYPITAAPDKLARIPTLWKRMGEHEPPARNRDVVPASRDTA